MVKVHEKYKSFEEVISRIHDTFNKEGVIIYDKRNTLKKFVLTDGEGKQLVAVVKKYGRINMFQKLCYSTFFSTKARRAFEYALYFLNHGISTPFPIAYVEIRKNMFLSQCYLLTEECSLPDCKFLQNHEDALPFPVSEKDHFIDSLAEYIVGVHDKGILHGDLNLSNILYEKGNDGEWRFSLIDINRTKFCSNPSKEKRLNNMMRLTHDRQASIEIVSAYARVMGWDEKECSDFVIGKITAFEHRRKLKRMIFKKKKR